MGISDLLETSKSALNANTQAIRTIGDNVANVNTPGYTRRRPDIVTNQPLPVSGVGTGVDVQRITRVVDDFINAQLEDRVGDRAYAEIREEFFGRAESSFSLDGVAGRIGYEFNEFVSSLQNLTTSPGNIPLRTQVVQQGQELVLSIRQTYGEIASLQREADDRIGILVQDVNRLSSAIAEVNGQIRESEISDQEALTLRDQRDQLIQELSGLVGFEKVENSDNTVNLYFANGFNLVQGVNSNSLEFTQSPSFEDAAPNGFPSGLDGIRLGHIVANYGDAATPQHIKLTDIIRNNGEGEIAGLLSLRGVQPQPDPAAATTAFDTQGDLVQLAGRVELFARDLLTRVNRQYIGQDDEDGGTAVFDSKSLDLDGNAANDSSIGDINTGGLNAFALFGFEDAESYIDPLTGDVKGTNGVPLNSDLDLIIAGGVTSLAQTLTFNISNERHFAAARDLDPVAGSILGSPGGSENIDAILSPLSTAPGVGYNLGVVSLTDMTLEDLYSNTVTTAGGFSRRASDDAQLYREREEQLVELKASISGVSLDEEFAKLINFQRGFQAASRLIQTGDELLTELLNSVS
jgi:flagellar hook-associated protein 1 FlgK